MTGTSFSTSRAASWPSFTSSAGLYLFLGAVTLVCAAAETTKTARLAATSVDFMRTRDIYPSSSSALVSRSLAGYCGNRAKTGGAERAELGQARESQVPHAILPDAERRHAASRIAPEGDGAD